MADEMDKHVRESLGKEIGDKKLASSGAAYERSRNIWNARVTHRPDLIVLCENAADAFGIRSSHQMLGIYSVFEPGEETPHRAWADEAEAALKPYALPGAYPNYLGAERPEQAAQGFGPNTERITQLKKYYDPKNIFQAISLPPQR